MTLPEQRPFIEGYTREQFEKAYEINFVAWRFVSKLEHRRKLFEDLRTVVENPMEDGKHKFSPRELNLLAELVELSGQSVDVAFALLSRMIENPDWAINLERQFEEIRTGTTQLRQKLDQYQVVTPESFYEIQLSELHRKKNLREQQRRTQLILNLKEGWRHKNLLPSPQRGQIMPHDDKVFLNQTIDCIAQIFLTREIIYNSQEFARLVRQRWDTNGHVLIFPRALSHLVCVIWYLGNEASLSTDARKYLDMEQLIDTREAFRSFREFAANDSEALFFASFYSHSTPSLQDRTFNELVARIYVSESKDFRERYRIAKKFDQNNAEISLEAASSQDLIEIAKDTDLHDPSEIFGLLIDRGIPASKLAEELTGHLGPAELKIILEDVQARRGEKELLQSIRTTRKKIGVKKNLRARSGVEIADTIIAAYQREYDESLLEIARDEYLSYGEPYVMLELLGDPRVPIEAKIEITQTLFTRGSTRLLSERLEELPELIAYPEIRHKYLSACKLLQKAPLALQEDVANNQTDFRDVLQAFTAFGEQERGLAFVSHNIDQLKEALSDPLFIKWLQERSNVFVYGISKLLPISDPTLIYKAALFARNQGGEEFAELRGSLVAQYEHASTPETAELVVSLHHTLEKLPDDLLEKAASSASFGIAGRAAAERGLRRFVAGETEIAKEIVEPFASDNLECALILYRIDEDPNLLATIAELTNEESRAAIQERWSMPFGQKLAPPTELDDPKYLINFIAASEAKLLGKARKGKSWVEEIWHCRKVAYNPSSICAFHQDPPKLKVAPKISDAEIRNFRPFDWNLSGRFTSNFQDSESRKSHAWQIQAIDSWVEHGRQGIVEAVTGSGKSRVGALAIAEALEDDFAVLLIVPTRPLGDQWITNNLQTFQSARVLNRIGNTTTELPVPFAQRAQSGFLTIAVKSHQAIEEVDRWIKSAAPGTRLMVIADEVHHLNGGSYQLFLRPEFERRMGLTATLMPYEYNQSRLKNYFQGDAIFKYDFAKAREDEVITSFEVIMLGVQVSDLDQVLYSKAEYEWRQARDRLQRHTAKEINPSEMYEFARSQLSNERLAEAAASFLEANKKLDDILNGGVLASATAALGLLAPLIARYGRTALFADIKANAKNVEGILAQRGVNAKVMTGDTLMRERDQLFAKLDAGDGELHAIAAPRVLDEGVDIQRLTIGCFVGRIRDRRVLTQRLGRVLRKHPEKKCAYAIILYVIGSEDDPNLPAGINSRLQRSEFSFIGQNAKSISSFLIGIDDERLKEHLSRL